MRSLHHISHLSIASWNVQGLKSKEFNKINDTQFVHEIQKHHIIALQETHTSGDMNININGYYTYQVCRCRRVVVASSSSRRRRRVVGALSLLRRRRVVKFFFFNLSFF
jgi:exonuclease III